jgi:hypothetical protein
MNHRLEKLKALLDTNESHQNVENITETSIDCENETRENNSCSPTINQNEQMNKSSMKVEILN